MGQGDVSISLTAAERLGAAGRLTVAQPQVRCGLGGIGAFFAEGHAAHAPHGLDSSCCYKR
jgi:hypothetical protein